MSLRLKLGLFLAFLFITAIGNAVFIYLMESNGNEKLHWVNHTHQVILETENYLGAMKDTETGQRGYLLTKDNAYLEPYHTGVVKAEKSFNKLKKMTLDHPEQQKRLLTVSKLMLLKFKELKETIVLTQKNNSKKSLIIVKRNEGKRYMDEIRRVFQDFVNEEHLILEQRNGDLKAIRAQIDILIIVEITVFIFLGIMTITFLNKHLFTPIDLLLSSTQKMQRGEKVEVSDITPNDEMGYLLSRFYVMNEKVHQRTQILDHQAHHDELTGLRNRTNVFKEVSESINIANQNNTKSVVLFLDLNQFKPLNDTMGHDAGDFVLKETATRLTASIRSDDVVYRIGGDEFLILIKNVTEMSTIELIISNIITSIEQPLKIKGKSITISSSIGVAIAPDDSINAEEIIKMADIAMYTSKDSKSPKHTFFKKGMLKRKND